MQTLGGDNPPVARLADKRLVPSTAENLVVAHTLRHRSGKTGVIANRRFFFHREMRSIERLTRIISVMDGAGSIAPLLRTFGAARTPASLPAAVSARHS